MGKKILLAGDSPRYKANLHCHTNLSDGKFSPEAVKAAYLAHGYSVVAFTDHDVFLQHPELCDAQFTALNGYEMEVNAPTDERGFHKTCHMCLIARTPDMVTPVCWHRSKYLFANATEQRNRVKNDPDAPDYERVYSASGISDMMRRGRDAGFFVTYNHPTWSCERYPDYTGYHGMHAMEIVNYSCYYSGFAEENQRVYDDLLIDGKERIFCVATDDNHGERDCFGGYTVIFAPSLAYTDITDALFAGNFYASTGAEITGMVLEDGQLTITMPGAREVQLLVEHCDARHVFAPSEEQPLTKVTVSVPARAAYFRVVVTDFSGRRAYTNAYFQDAL